jgi:hypothetical protein
MDKSQWQIRPRFIAMLVIGCGLWFVIGAILQELLTGNERQSAAVFFWRKELSIWKNSTTNSQQFNFEVLPSESKHATIAFGSYWNSWIKTNFVWSTYSNREMILVCARKCVPKPGLLNVLFLHPTYVVGYSDGTIGLISPTEFTNLNLSGFVPAVSLVTNSEFKISKP